MNELLKLFCEKKFAKNLEHCKTFEQLDKLHSCLCRRVQVKDRKVFLEMINEHYEKLLLNEELILTVQGY